MRISDWSSDVCSSDLMFLAPRLGQLECLETQDRKDAGHDIEQQPADQRARQSQANSGKAHGLLARWRTYSPESVSAGRNSPRVAARRTCGWGKSVTVRGDVVAGGVVKKTNTTT